ncbi:MAG: hypothetical protein JKY86_08585 [Gammaproteobacteria bacterium]|nr:hypothetical protein [Gammaproteobacteria bacterium]
MLYALMMKGANSHLISVTFNNIQSVDAKLFLLTSCFSLFSPRNEDLSKLVEWKSLRKKVQKLNKKRNKIVHEPITLEIRNGKEIKSITPSIFNALPLVIGQTTNKSTVISEDYTPSNAILLDAHRIDIVDLIQLERMFKEQATELSQFKKKVSKFIAAALQSANKLSD